MKEPNITQLKKYLNALTKIKAKYVTSERLSRVVGIYPEVINETFSYFDPMVTMDFEYNLLELVPQVKKYISDKENKKAPIDRSLMTTKRDLIGYESISDFIYQKLTISGMINKSATLSDKDLKVLKRLISDEQARRKKL